MNGDFTGLAAKIRNRLAEQDNPAFKDITKPLPNGTLTRQEFSIAVAQQWVDKKGYKWHFTEKFAKLAAQLPPPHLEESEDEKKPPQTSPYKQKVRHVENEMPAVVEPQGPNQVKIMEIIYRGTNNLGHPNLLIIGEDAEKNMRRIVRGIPLDLGKQLCQHPQRYSGKVVAVDEKNNFVGIVMGQVTRAKVTQQNLPTHPAPADTKYPTQTSVGDAGNVPEPEDYHPGEWLSKEELEQLRQRQEPDINP
jgi:hypothetical protein